MDGLTDRELEVLRLVAAGRSNPQIATELLMSAKSASAHVSRILAKSRVSSRGEAAAAAAPAAYCSGSHSATSPVPGIATSPLPAAEGGAAEAGSRRFG
jgi:DNA-binding CsgD family transcriptional regulator